jgi:uncharacterized protein
VIVLAAGADTSIAVAVTVLAVVAVSVAWELVRRGRFEVWGLMGWLVAVLALKALLTGKVRAATEFGLPAAIGIGLAAGVALYGATAAFMFVAGRWPPLARQARRVYELRAGRSTASAAAIAALVVAPGEEIVWRGLVQTLLAGVLGAAGGAAAAWAIYVGVNAVSRSLPIILAAVVGGGAWAALAWWTGGIAASAACHAVWTSLMIVAPPISRSP